MRNKVFVVGLDGGSFNLLQPWIEEGELPNIKDLMENGVYGEMKSTMPPMTAPAWNSIITGMNPGKHGVFDFMIRDRKTNRYLPVSSCIRQCNTIWDYVGRNRGKVVVLNIPTTYPPDRVQGVLISGWLTPAGRKDFIYPPEILSEIEDKFGEYLFYPRTLNVDDFLTECMEVLDYKFMVARYLVEQVDPDLLMLHILGSDQICHWLWHILDRDHPQHKLTDFRKYGDRILDYFRKFDTDLEKLVKKTDSNTSLFVISDHGFGPVHKIMEMNVWLLQQRYISLKKNSSVRLKFRLWKLGLTHESLYSKSLLFRRFLTFFNKLIKIKIKLRKGQVPVGQKWRARALLTMNDIDWSKTRAFSPNFGSITINFKDKSSQKSICFDDEYQDFRNEIIRKVRNLRDPEKGNLMISDVFAKEEVYNGKCLEKAPDILFWAINNRYLVGGVFPFESNKVVTEPWLGLTGHHSMMGILIGKGKNIRKGVIIKDAKIVDMAPTILYLMGLKIPYEMDGRVLSEIFTEKFCKGNKIEFTKVAIQKEREQRRMTKEEEELILERLRTLGYIG